MRQAWNERGSVRGLSLRVLFAACLSAILLSLFVPLVASAHAILLRSDPAKDVILRSAPRGVRMGFSEDLTPVISTAAVLNAQSLRVDQQDAHVSPDDAREMDLTLPADLPLGPYLVLWRTGSADDGYTLRGSLYVNIGLSPLDPGPEQEIYLLLCTVERAGESLASPHGSTDGESSHFPGTVPEHDWPSESHASSATV